MTPTRRRRLVWVIGILAGVGLASALALRAFQQNVTFYFDPSKIAAGEVKPGEAFRLGGLVQKGSLVRTPGTLQVRFVVTDFRHSVSVRYDKVLPDLFREGAGVVAHGRLNAQGVFIADDVLAKHDSNYMPPPVARSLEQAAASGAPGAASAVAAVAGGAR
ncbi:MAG TPA: cytochrome c maturation protein CcmE [Steroidobacteraceae bacterium]|nr:cytochrome c maturation protein CcmE [Steroidobacteraceae bacterium]